MWDGLQFYCLCLSVCKSFELSFCHLTLEEGDYGNDPHPCVCLSIHPRSCVQNPFYTFHWILMKFSRFSCFDMKMCRCFGFLMRFFGPSYGLFRLRIFVFKACVCYSSYIFCLMLFKMCKFSCYDLKMCMWFGIFFIWSFWPFSTEFPFAKLVSATHLLLGSFEICRFSCYGMKVCMYFWIFDQTVFYVMTPFIPCHAIVVGYYISSPSVHPLCLSMSTWFPP